MEKSLLEKMKNGTCDEIDRDMIIARVGVAGTEMMKLVSKFCDDLKNLTTEYKDELRMIDFGIVLGCTEMTDEFNGGADIGSNVMYGSSKQLKKIFNKLQEIAG